MTDLGNGESRTPLFFEYVQAYTSIAIYVWMENFGPERNLSHTKTSPIFLNIFEKSNFNSEEFRNKA